MFKGPQGMSLAGNAPTAAAAAAATAAVAVAVSANPHQEKMSRLQVDSNPAPRK